MVGVVTVNDVLTGMGFSSTAAADQAIWRVRRPPGIHSAATPVSRLRRQSLGVGSHPPAAHVRLEATPRTRRRFWGHAIIMWPDGTSREGGLRACLTPEPLGARREVTVLLPGHDACIKTASPGSVK